MPTYIRKPKNQRYYIAIVDIPKDVRAVIGKTQFKRSLRTENRAEALRKSIPIVDAWQRAIEAARGANNDSLEELQRLVVDIRSDLKTADRASKENLEHALIAIEQELAEMANATTPEAYAKVTMRAVMLPELLEQQITETDLTPKSLKDKRRWISEFERVVNKPIQQISKRDVIGFVEHLQQDNKHPTTIKKALSYLSSVFRFATDKLIVDTPNPFTDVKVASPKVRKSDLRQPFSVKDIHRLHSAIVDRDDTDLLTSFMIAAHTGMRIAEVVSLTSEDIVDGFFHVRGTKTYSSERVIPIAPVLLPLVSNPDFKIDASADAIGKRFSRLKSALGYDDRFVFHSLRHSFATWLQTTGTSEHTAASILGHSTTGFSMSFGLYSSGASIEQKREAVNAVETLLALEVDRALS